MAELDDQYLLGWGYSGALVPSLEKLLDSDELSQSRRLHTESLLVRVLLQQGEYAQAIQRAARSAESARGFGRGESRVKFRVQLVGAPMELDDLQTATMYSQATIRAALRDGGPSPLVDAVSALAMCQARAGMFGPASRKLTAVRPLLSACRTKANRLLRPRVFINLAWIQGQLGDRDRARDLLRAGHRLAAALDDRRLQGRCQLHEAELALDDGDLEDAVDLAEQAAALAIRGGSRELCRDAKETVVLANLSADRLAAAAAAARIAGRHHTSVRGLVLTGLVAYRYGDRDQAARAAFREGCALAERLRRPDERSFQLLDSHGLAACGLALLGERDQLDTAVAAHQAARRVTSVAGAVRRALLMLDQFRPRADTRILDQVRTAARGGFGQ
jgi:tetratricopeptide (TPR) repeat protein